MNSSFNMSLPSISDAENYLKEIRKWIERSLLWARAIPISSHIYRETDYPAHRLLTGEQMGKPVLISVNAWGICALAESGRQ
jgi:hypothetical protein